MLKPIDPRDYGIPYDPRAERDLLAPPLYAKPFFDPAALERLRQKADRMLRALMRHRERYLKAWIAQTGILPTDAVLVEREVWDRETVTIVKVVEVVTKAEAVRRYG